jgi:hypothetical protein
MALVIGIIVIVSTVRSGRKARSSASWPATEGTIVASEISRTVDANRSQLNTGVGMDQGIYRPRVEFTYTVAGKEYTGRTFTLSYYSTNKETATEITRRYPVGKSVSVYYNPGDQSEATLETGENRFGSVFMLVLAGFFVSAGLLVTAIEALVLIARR